MIDADIRQHDVFFYIATSKMFSLDQVKKDCVI